MDDPEGFLRSLFDKAVAAASDFSMIPGLIPRVDGRVRVLGAGKAAARMAAAIEAAPPKWLVTGQIDGLVVTPAGHGLPLSLFASMTAGHPVPNEASLAAGEQMLALAEGLQEEDLLVALLSGGASALLAAPIHGATLQDEIDLNHRLLRSGLPISQMNAARARISCIKGGGLARAAAPARVITFVVSDVPDDEPSRVGSGPTIAPLPISLSETALAMLPDIPFPEPSGPMASKVHVVITARDAIASAEREARAHGLNVLNLGSDLEGEARELGREHAVLARRLAETDRPCLVLSGGETSVTVQGGGRGGRNTEYLAGFMQELGPLHGVWALAADSDGLDGAGPCAGAIVRPDSHERVLSSGIDADKLLQNNDTLTLLEAVGDVIITGPTRTNVNDFRAVLIL